MAAVAAVAIAVPVLGAGQPDARTTDVEPTVADGRSDPEVEVTLLDGLDIAREDAGLAPLTPHPELARLARGWAAVMATTEETAEDLADCADLDSQLPGPVWHPTDPHLDLSSTYLGELGEVVGCYADEVDAASFLERRLVDEQHAAELLEPDWRFHGAGAVGSASGATFVAIVLADGTLPLRDAAGIDAALAASSSRPAGDDATVVLAGAGEASGPLLAAPIAEDRVHVLFTDRPAAPETDPILAVRTRHAIDRTTGGEGRVLLLGDEDATSARAERELDAVGYRVERFLASGFGVDPSAPVVAVTDAAGSVHEPAITALAEARVTLGRGDGRFDPGASITRGEVAAFIARSLGLPPGPAGAFPDTDGHVHAAAIDAVAQAGIVSGFVDGTFGPNALVSRGQLATMLSAAFDVPAVPPPSRFADVDGTTHAAAIDAIADLGSIRGFSDGTFRPNATATRGQVATMLFNTVVLADGEVAR
jgi:hypothetical protein